MSGKDLKRLPEDLGEGQIVDNIRSYVIIDSVSSDGTMWVTVGPDARVCSPLKPLRERTLDEKLEEALRRPR